MTQLFPQNPGQAPRPPQAGPQGGQQGAPQAPQMPQRRQPPQTDSNLLEYLQRNQGQLDQTAGQLMGERPQPNYAPAMLQVGSSLLQGSGDVTRSLGRGIEQAIPLMQQAQAPALQHDQARQQVMSDLAMQDYQQQQDRIQAREDAQAELEGWKWKQDYEAFLDQMGEGPEIKQVGNVAVDENAFRNKVRQGKDRRQAFEESVVYNRPTAPEQRYERYNAMLQHAEGLRLRGEEEAAQSVEEQAERFKEWTGPTEEFVQTWTRDPETDKLIPFSGPAGEVAGQRQRFFEEGQGRKMRNVQQSAANSLAMTGRLMELSKESDVISQGRAGDYASMMSGWAKAGRELMGDSGRREFQSRIGSDPQRFLRELQESDDPAVKMEANPELLDYLEGLGEESARIQTNVFELGYAIARDAKAGEGRVTNADIARALRQIAYNEDNLINDPAALQAGLMENASGALARHNRTMRSYDPQYDAVTGMSAVELPRAGFMLDDINDPWSLRHVGTDRAQQWWDDLTSGERRQAEQAQQESGEQPAQQQEPSQQGPQQGAQAQQRPAPPADRSQLPSVTTPEELQNLEPGSYFLGPDGRMGFYPGPGGQ